MNDYRSRCWYALYLAIVKNMPASKALKAMGFERVKDDSKELSAGMKTGGISNGHKKNR